MLHIAQKPGGAQAADDNYERTGRDYADSFEEACRKADEEKRQREGKSEAEIPLPYVDLALDPIPPRQWLVPERIPMRNVTLLSGEGSIGKSILLMQLSGAVALVDKDWIGTLPEPGPVLYVSCEEDDDEIRRRMEDVARHFGSTRQEMWGLRVLSFAGKDAVLAQPDRFGIMRPTPLFERIRRDALDLRPKLIVIDNVADVFAGKEIDRAQTRQFITLLRGLAVDTGAAVVMSAHPSLTGISTDTGLSGSTGWHNSVRARMYFKAAPGADTTLRVLEVKKNNYGPVNESIVLRWKDGVYVVEPGKGTLDRLAAEADVDHLFIKLLRRFTEQGRNVSDKSGTSYAPAQFAKQSEAKQGKVTGKAFAEAMERLFTVHKIRVLTEGPPSHPRTRLIEASTDPSTDFSSKTAPDRSEVPITSTHPASSTDPSTDLPPPSTGVCVPPPYNPPPGGTGKWAVEAPTHSTGTEEPDQ
jgi:RecA-family ATPase